MLPKDTKVMHEIEEDKKYLHAKVPIYGKPPLLETCGA